MHVVAPAPQGPCYSIHFLCDCAKSHICHAQDLHNSKSRGKATLAYPLGYPTSCERAPTEQINAITHPQLKITVNGL